jgi:hypothetical protein
MKAYCESGSIAPHILNIGIDGSEWSASRSGHFTPGERSPGARWIGGYVGRRAGLKLVEKRKIPSLCRESNPDRPSRSLVTTPTELSLLHEG